MTRLLEAPASNGSSLQLKLILEVQNGIVETIKMTMPTDVIPADFNPDASVITNLRGTRYSHEVTESIVAATGCKTVYLDTVAQKSNVAATQWRLPPDDGIDTWIHYR